MKMQEKKAFKYLCETFAVHMTEIVIKFLQI